MRNPSRLLIGTWCLGTFVLASTYAGSLISMMLVKTLNAPFTDTESLAHCIQRGDCIVVTNSMDISMVQYMLQSKDSSAKILQAALLKTPIEVVSPMSALLTKIVEDDSKFFVYPITDSYFEALTDVHERCRYFKAGILFNVDLAFGINPKKAQQIMTEKFNNTINRMHAAHFVQGTMGRYLYTPADCSKERNPENNLEELGASTMLGVFVILFMGLSTAILAFAYEFAIGAFGHKRHGVEESKSDAADLPQQNIRNSDEIYIQNMGNI